MCLQLPEASSSASPECLVTVVLKASMGGIFEPTSWFRPVLFFLDSWERTWIENLLMTVVALRDKVCASISCCVAGCGDSLSHPVPGTCYEHVPAVSNHSRAPKYS